MRTYNLAGGAKTRRRWWLIIGSVLLLILLVFALYKLIGGNISEPMNDEEYLIFDDSVTDAERHYIAESVKQQNITLNTPVSISISTAVSTDKNQLALAAYVPVTNVYSAKQSITKAELKNAELFMAADTDEKIITAIASQLEVDASELSPLSGSPEEIDQSSVAFIPASQLNPSLKLLSFEGEYYLDSFISGAVLRQVELSGDGASAMPDINLNKLANKDSTLKVNMSGVTALTRLMMTKLNSVQDPKYFSAKIGGYLADADITHVSNEVSFQPGCQYSNTSFCSPPQFIETLKDSGVDLVEITGNHNNDRGSSYNTDTINQYHELGWDVVGGGLNSAEAVKPYVAEQKGSKVTFLAYNMADGLGSGAIASETTAGANFYTDEKAKTDIESAKQNSDFVVVNIQYAECQAYPSGYVEYPICDSPIPGQEEDFKQLIDFGADMVVGSSAHQPQTFEFYKGKPIYYGLGNMYFDQYQWPGTERGIILSHYFIEGELIQTKLLITDFDRDLQTRPANPEESEMLLKRLNQAR